MAINKNHEFEELNGVKCGIVEKNASKPRADFLESILAHNGYQVVIVPSAPPKAAAAKVVTENPEPVPAPPETFTVGVTDYTFNAVNAIFGRLLKTPSDHVVTLAYWQGKDAGEKDDIPYFDQKL